MLGRQVFRPGDEAKMLKDFEHFTKDYKIKVIQVFDYHIYVKPLESPARWNGDLAILIPKDYASITCAFPYVMLREFNGEILYNDNEIIASKGLFDSYVKHFGFYQMISTTQFPILFSYRIRSNGWSLFLDGLIKAGYVQQIYDRWDHDDPDLEKKKLGEFANLNI